jgi:hypothetical protein
LGWAPISICCAPSECPAGGRLLQVGELAQSTHCCRWRT